MNGRVDIAEIPFISGDLSVRFHVPFPGEEVELLFGESGVDHGQRDAMEGCIPCGEEGIFPPEPEMTFNDFGDQMHIYAHLSGMERISAIYM